MFRSWSLRFFLLLMTHFAAAAPAQAVDVATVSFDVTIARSSLVSDDITVEVRVIGTNLNNGALTPATVGPRRSHSRRTAPI